VLGENLEDAHDLIALLDSGYGQGTEAERAASLGVNAVVGLGVLAAQRLASAQALSGDSRAVVETGVERRCHLAGARNTNHLSVAAQRQGCTIGASGAESGFCNFTEDDFVLDSGGPGMRSGTSPLPMFHILHRNEG
jgi:hypothetical protein